MKLADILGIGPITTSAIVTTVGDASEFKNARQDGGVDCVGSKAVSSGGNELLLGISKRGDTYLRTLLIHGARAVIRFEEKKAEQGSWLRKLMARRNKHGAAVAQANKNARIIWALLVNGSMFRPDYTPAAAAAGA